MRVWRLMLALDHAQLVQIVGLKRVERDIGRGI